MSSYLWAEGLDQNPSAPGFVTTGHREFTRLSSAAVQQVVNSCLSNQVLDLPELNEQRGAEDPLTLRFWEDNKPLLVAAVDRVELALGRFETVEARPSASSSAIPSPSLAHPKATPWPRPSVLVPISVEFDREGVLINRSKLLRRGKGEGIHVDSGEHRLLKVSLANGKGAIVLGVMTPHLSRFNLGAVLLCPFENTASDKPSKGLDLLTARFDVRAQAEGKLSHGGEEPGRAQGSILTSESIPPSLGPVSSSVSVDPVVSLRYLSAENLKTQPISLKSMFARPEIIGGVSAKLDLHAPNGYRRVSTYSEVIWVQKVTLPEDSKLSFLEDKKSAFSKVRDPCFIVVKDRLREIIYSKEDLVIESNQSRSVVGSSILTE